MHFLILFCLFLGWSYILSIIADFLIHNKIKLIIPNALQSILYLACTCSFLSLSLTSFADYPIFFVLSSALWITIFTDIEHMLISRITSLYLIPVGILASYYDLLTIDPTESAFAAIFVSSILFAVNFIFRKLKGFDGLGQGDIELMGCIAAWLGFIGAWFTLLVGSTIGVLSCILYMLTTRKNLFMIPFGPFLSLGSLVFMIFNKTIINNLTF